MSRSTRRSRLVDVTIGVAVAAVLGLISRHVPPTDGDRALDGFGYVLLVIAGLSMGACRRWPRTTAAVVTAVLVAFIARSYPNGPVWLTGWVVIVAVGWRGTRRAAVIAALGMLAALSVAAAAFDTTIGWAIPLIFVGWLAVAVLLGEALRNRRVHLAGLAERARFLQRAREQETARRVAEERLRIARDLHDGVAHALATINVQAGAAAHVLERRPQAAGEALSVIARASGEVLDELEVILRVLRQDGDGPAERAPTPGLPDIARLVDGTRQTGLTVTAHLPGGTPAVSAPVSTAAYRVVQEALTNVLRHSRARRVRVRVAAGTDWTLRVEVSDPGPAVDEPVDGTGVGLRGMAERVTATGGRLRAGPTGTGGFAVSATWPLAPDPAP